MFKKVVFGGKKKQSKIFEKATKSPKRTKSKVKVKVAEKQQQEEEEQPTLPETIKSAATSAARARVVPSNVELVNSEDDSLTGSSHLPQDPGAVESAVTDLLFSPKTGTKVKSKKKKTKLKDGSTSTRKKKKKVEESKLSGDESDSSLYYLELAQKEAATNDVNDDASFRSSRSTGTSKSTKSTKGRKKKKKSSNKDADDSSVSSRQSRKGRRGSKQKPNAVGGTFGDKLENIDALESHPVPQSSTTPTTAYSGRGKQEEDDTDLRAENDALQAETATLRKQLKGTLEMLDSSKANLDMEVDLQKEKDDLQAESANLGKQLTETLAMLDDARTKQFQSQRSSIDSTQMQMDLKRAQNEASEFKSEVEEYEEAVVEKDGLIKKLTEAVDCQLDKVEYLELKLQRAEEEFCKMEDEMKDMEEDIEVLKFENAERSSPGADSLDFPAMTKGSTHSAGSAGSLREVADDMQKRLIEDKKKRLSTHEVELEERGADLYDREQDMLDRERDLEDREQDLLDQTEADLGEEMDQVRMKELRLNERERELLELEGRLAASEKRQKEQECELSEKTREEDDKSVDVSMGDSPDSPDNKNEPETSQIEAIELLKTKIEEQSKEKEELYRKFMERQHEEGDYEELMTELKSRVKEYQIEIAEVRAANQEMRRADVDRTIRDSERQVQLDLELQTIQEGTNNQLKELDEENRKLQAEITVLEEINTNLHKAIPDENVDPMDHAMAELQDEIAELREKIVDKERYSKTQRELVDHINNESEEHKIEIQDLETELVNLVTQLQDTKDTATKKMAQKDETIAFMQNEMIRIMKEKSKVDQTLKEKHLEQNEPEMLRKHGKQNISAEDEETERKRLQAINEQFAVLDNENAELQEKLKQAKYENELKLKEKDGRILEVEEELADVNWEMKARKEADFVSLLKDRKERKKDLETTKKTLKKAEERVADLERDLQELKQHQNDLEEDVNELNKSLVSRDSGDYVSGLKRQIRSLKEHNMALERNLEIETSNTKGTLEKKEEKISRLQDEVRNLKNPAQAAVRGMFSFGKRDLSSTSETPQSKDTENDEASDKRESHTIDGEAILEIGTLKKSSTHGMPPAPNRKSALWNAIISPFGGSKRSLRSADFAGAKDGKKLARTNSISERVDDVDPDVTIKTEAGDHLEGALSAIELEANGITHSEREATEGDADEETVEKGQAEKPQEKECVIDDRLHSEDIENIPGKEGHSKGDGEISADEDTEDTLPTKEDGDEPPQQENSAAETAKTSGLEDEMSSEEADDSSSKGTDDSRLLKGDGGEASDEESIEAAEDIETDDDFNFASDDDRTAEDIDSHHDVLTSMGNLVSDSKESSSETEVQKKEKVVFV